MLERARVLDLIVRRGICYGVRASIAGRATEIIADATVLATGGCGQVVSIHDESGRRDRRRFRDRASRPASPLADMEFVQFHPTALDTPENPLVLISEAVRGEGAVLVNARGVRFMRGRHQTRRAGAARRRGAGDLSRAAHGPRLPRRSKARRGIRRYDFPESSRSVRPAESIRARDLIPVTPAAHYMMGGVVTDLRGRASAQRLYAVGEVARTGVHGANRLASNSLLEGLVFAERVARDLSSRQAARPGSRRREMEGAAAARSRRGAGRSGRDPRRHVGGRRHRPHRARSPSSARAAR